MTVILFDFFGVISTPVYKVVIEKYISPDRHDRWMKMLDQLDTGHYSELQFATMIASEANQPLKSVQDTVKEAPHVDYELLSYIENQLLPHMRVGLLTNIHRTLLEAIMEDKLAQFDPLLVSSDLGMVKPNPDIFKVAIERSECTPEDIVFVDDSSKNIEVASSFGINAILYQGLESLKNKIEPLL